MTRLTPEELAELLDIVEHRSTPDVMQGVFDADTDAARARITAEIDALRAEIEFLRHETKAARNAYLEVLDTKQAENERLNNSIAAMSMKMGDQMEEIATFRNASPSLCNCSQCDTQCPCGKRKEFAE